MSLVFADAVYFIALANPRDQYHQRASQVNVANRSMVTTQYVLTEVADALARHDSRQLFVDLVAYLEAASGIEVVTGSDHLYRSGLGLYRERPDKDWSLTDCISFSIMQHKNIIDALTADHHFEQAGFTALLK